MLIYTSHPDGCELLGHVAFHTIIIERFKEESMFEFISGTFQNISNGEELASQLQSQIWRKRIMRKILHIPINVAIVYMLSFLSLLNVTRHIDRAVRTPYCIFI